MLYSMWIGIATLAALALIFALIGARSSNGRWIIGTIVCSLAAGILGSILCMKYGVGLMAYFNAALSKGLQNALDTILMALLFALMLFLLARVAAGLIRPLKRDEKPNNPLWRAVAYGVCALFGAACTGYFIFAAGSHLIKGVNGSSDVVFICVGTLYLLIGIAGLAQWNNRRKRLIRDKQKQEAKAQATSVQEAPAVEAPVQTEPVKYTSEEENTGHGQV